MGVCFCTTYGKEGHVPKTQGYMEGIWILELDLTAKISEKLDNCIDGGIWCYWCGSVATILAGRFNRTSESLSYLTFLLNILIIKTHIKMTNVQRVTSLQSLVSKEQLA